MSLARLRGETVDVRLWTPVDQVESQALTQLRNIASLPWVAHVAVTSGRRIMFGCVKSFRSG